MQSMTVDNLTSKQRAHLRSLAHDLNPVVHIGKEGITEPVLASIDNAFNTRELLKVKVLDGSPRDTRDTGYALAEEWEDMHVVQVIGHIVVLYRPFADNPEINLPA